MLVASSVVLVQPVEAVSSSTQQSDQL